jgi:hypothetical protein
VFVVVLIALCTAYNNLLWRTIKKQAAKQASLLTSSS